MEKKQKSSLAKLMILLGVCFSFLLGVGVMAFTQRGIAAGVAIAAGISLTFLTAKFAK